MKKNITLCAIATALILTTPLGARAEEKGKQLTTKLTTGFHYSEGDYGATSDTKIKYVPTSLSLKYNDWTTKITVPYLSITGPGVVIGGGDTGTTGGPVSPVSTESGLGDVMLSLQKRIKLNKKGTSLKLTGKAKVPTADEDKKLGTGKFDFILETGLTQVIGNAYVTGKVGRKFAGRTSRYNFRDTWRFSAGGGYQFKPIDLTLGTTYSYKQSSSTTGTNSSQMMVYLVKGFEGGWSAQLYGTAGFTDGTADNAVGLMISKSFTFPFGD